MDSSGTFTTDAATLAAFDPAVLASRVDDDAEWWCNEELGSVPEVKCGDAALVSLAGDDVYKVRVTDGELTAAERAYAIERLTLGVRVTSGKLFVGAGEELPGDGTSVTPDGNHRGFFVDLAPGAYTVQLHAIAWEDSPEWWTPEGTPTPASAPADVVLQATPRVGAFVLPSDALRVFALRASWLFPEAPRRLGPEPGMLLTTAVFKRGDALVLQPCGPLDYRPVLDDLAGLAWHDRVEVRVIEVDHAARQFRAALVRKKRGR